jgi:peroxiredoxin
MSQLRDFARHKEEFDARKVRIVALSVDDLPHARKVWEKVADRSFTILSDPEAKVIHKYGLLHPGGHDGEDIAIRTTVFIDEQGIERWRRVSETVPDIPSVAEVLQNIPPAK